VAAIGTTANDDDDDENALACRSDDAMRVRRADVMILWRLLLLLGSADVVMDIWILCGLLLLSTPRALAWSGGVKRICGNAIELSLTHDRRVVS
jgi:hypothetical protein